MAGNRLNFYHVTTAENFYKIIDDNLIRPALARSVRKLSWYTKRENVPWSIAHAIARHKCGLDKLVVIKVQCSTVYMHQWGTSPMWFTRVDLSPVAHDAAGSWLIRDELNQAKIMAQIEGNDWYDHLK